MHDYHSPMTPVVVEMMAILMVAMASAPVLWSLVDLRGCPQVIILYPHMQISADLEGRRCPRENLHYHNLCSLERICCTYTAKIFQLPGQCFHTVPHFWGK